MRLYFHFSVHDPVLHQVALRLKADHGVSEMGGFAWGQDQADALKATGFPWWRLDVFTAWLADLPGWRLDMDYLREAEGRYGLPNLARMVFADRNLAQRHSHDEILKIIEICLKKLIRLFDEDRPDAIFATAIDSLPTFLLYAVARSRGVPLIHLDSGRIGGRVAVTHDPIMTWSDVDSAFEARRTQPLVGEARVRAEEFLNRFRDRPKRIQSPRRWMFPSPRFTDLRRLIGASRRYRRDPLNPVLSSPWSMVRQKITRLTNHKLTSWLGLFEEPVPGEPYVLFPLHYQPEVATLVMGHYYLDQPALIEDIAKSLPVGHRLYVKEHFFSIGRRPLADYRRIKKSFNVRLIGPMHDPLKLVSQAAAVATISGTMGWEAVLLERPAITFGDCFYNSYPQVIRAGLVPKTGLTQLFTEALTTFRPDRELLLKYIAAILEATYEGYFSFDHAALDPDLAMREENFRNIAGVIAAELGLSAWRVPSQGAA